MSSEPGHSKEVESIKADARAIQHMKKAIASGKHWYLALVEAIKLWRSTEEDYNGIHYTYLIDGEAFDWLTLAERLCAETSDLIPENELIQFLFFDRPPVELSKEEFKRLIGTAKYRAYLNYLYGVLIEEALIMSVVAEVRKARRSQGFNRYDDEFNIAYLRIYESGEQELWDNFRADKHYPTRSSITLSQYKEFLYWLFKYRLKRSEKSRVASDTRKALLYLQKNVARRKPDIS